MKKGLTLAACLCALIMFSGCAYKFAYTTGLPPADEKITQWQNVVVWGWVTPGPVYLDKLSPNGVAEFGSYESFTNWLCTFFTIGFYSPQTVYVILARTQTGSMGGGQ